MPPTDPHQTSRAFVALFFPSGQEPLLAEFVKTRNDAICWIGANQLGRRNLDASRKAAFALELEKQLAEEAKQRLRDSAHRTNAALGRKGETGVAILPHPSPGKARDQAAALTGAGARYISEAKAIQDAAPEILEQVKQGKLTIPQAKRVAALPAAERPEAIARAKRGESIEPGGYIWRDGELIATESNEEIRLHHHRLFRIIEAVQAFAKVDVSVKDYLYFSSNASFFLRTAITSCEDFARRAHGGPPTTFHNNSRLRREDSGNRM